MLMIISQDSLALKLLIIMLSECHDFGSAEKRRTPIFATLQVSNSDSDKLPLEMRSARREFHGGAGGGDTAPVLMGFST